MRFPTLFRRIILDNRDNVSGNFNTRFAKQENSKPKQNFLIKIHERVNTEHENDSLWSLARFNDAKKVQTEKQIYTAYVFGVCSSQ